jgi:hypothetical protein
MKKTIVVFALFFTHVVDATITLKDLNEIRIQIDINGHKIDFCKMGMRVSNEGSHVKIESISTHKIELLEETNGTTFFYIGYNIYPIHNPCLFSEDHKILRIFECHETAQKYQSESQKSQPKKRNIYPSQNEPPAKRSASCGSIMSNSNLINQEHSSIQQKTRARTPTLPYFPYLQQTKNIPQKLLQFDWHTPAFGAQGYPFHEYNPYAQHPRIKRPKPLAHQHSQTEESQTPHPIQLNQPPIQNKHSSLQSNLPIQPRNTPPLAIPKPIINLSTPPLAQPNSTRFEQSNESIENPIINADINLSSAKDLINELYNEIIQEFLSNNQRYMQISNMTNQVTTPLGKSDELAIKLKKELEKEIILENKKEIIKKIKELITETLKEKDFNITDDDWSDNQGKDQDFDINIDDWFN